jgi:hypothetical protein
MTGEAGPATSARRPDAVTGPLGDLEVALAAGTRAQYADGDLRASREHFERAYRLAEQAADVPAMAQAALGLAGLWVRERRTVTGAAGLETRLAHVLSLLGERSSLALRIRARLAGEADYARGEHAAVLAVLDEARTLADPVLLAESLSIAHHCVLGPEHAGRRRDLAAELTRASFRTGRRGDLLMGLLWQTIDAYLDGDPHAGRLLGELRGQLAERDHLAVGFVVSAIDVMLAIRAGHFGAAEALAAACAERGAAAGDADHDWWSAAQLVTIRWYQGRLAELLPALHDRVHSPDLSTVDNSAAAALAVAAALSGDRSTAASSLATLRGPGLAALPRSSSWLVTMNGVIEAAGLLGDAALAAEAYEVLAPHADRPMMGGLGATCFGAAHQALGVAALTTGQPDRAAGHLEAAVQRNLALGHWPAVVSSRRRLALAYAARGRAGDVGAARRELDTAATEAQALGLPGPGDAAPWPAGPWSAGPESAGPESVGPEPAGPWSAGPWSAGPWSAGSGSAGSGSATPGSAVPWSAAARAGSGAPRSGAAGSAAPVAEAQCRRAGRNWRVTWRGRSVVVDDSIGLAHLAVLLANPRQEIQATDLARGLAVLTRAAAASAGDGDGGGRAGEGTEAGRAASGGGQQAVLDATAVAEYRDRLRQLDVESAGPDGADDDAAARAHTERDWLVGQLAAATGLGGRPRAFPDDAERARIAVGKAVRRALARIADADPLIGEHLRQSIRTGTRCSYWPG